MPYILNTEEQIKEMLQVIGVSSIDKLYEHIPDALRLQDGLSLPEGLSEYEVKRVIDELSGKNKPLETYNAFLGAGCYDHYIPQALIYLLSNSPFVTAYTPYQAECSQGILQALYEYQSYMCTLTGMDVSNASLLDGASSMAEAVLMALRITRRKKIIIAGFLHPEYRQTLTTYLAGFDFVIQDVQAAGDGCVDLVALRRALDEDTACCVLQSPNFFGLIEDVAAMTPHIQAQGALAVMVTNPLSLAILKHPASLGVAIACGDGQPLGGSLSFGGSSFGFLATRVEYMRQMPGRLVGKTTDAAGRPAYCLTLQAREQHIRREKARSNICSNQSLNVIAAAIYLSLMGRKGLQSMAAYSLRNTSYLYQRLKQVRGVHIPFAPRIFNEFLWEVDDAPRILNELRAKGIIAGYYVGNVFGQYKNGILSCCTEKKTKDDIDIFVHSLAEVLHG